MLTVFSADHLLRKVRTELYGGELVPPHECAERAQIVLDRVRTDALVVSLGVDTYAGDPISSFRLQSPDFCTYGRMIGACGLPTLFVLEGGYAVGEIGVNVVNVPTGFEDP